MVAEWYYRTSAGRAEGPVAAAHLKQLAQLGEIGPATEIKKGAEGRWITANKVKGLLDAAPPKPMTTKTALPTWMQPVQEGDEPDSASPRPKSPAPLVRRPPVDAEADDEDDRRLPVRRTAPTDVVDAEYTVTSPPTRKTSTSIMSWPDVVDAEYTVTSPAKQRSPLLLVGAGVGGTLLVVGVMVAMVGFGGSDKGTTDRPADRTDPVAVGDKQRRDVPPANFQPPPPAQEPNQPFIEAKKVLLDSLSDAGGSPVANVNKGIVLLTKYLAQPNISDRKEATSWSANDAAMRTFRKNISDRKEATSWSMIPSTSSSLAQPNISDRKEAALLLEHAQVAVSDEKAMQLLLAISDYERKKLAGETDNRTDVLIVPKSQVEALSLGFSERLETKVEKEGQETRVFITGQSSVTGGQYHSSIETALYETLKKNAKRGIELVASERQKQEEKRQAAREENPKLTALIFSIEDKPEAFAGRCMYFDDFGMYGKTDKESDTDYRLGVTDSRGKFYTSVGFQEKEIVFSTSRKVAAQIQALTQDDNKYKVKLYCDMYVSTRGGPWAVIYKIELYNRGGGVAFTVKD